MINVYKVLVRKSNGKRPHGRPMHVWEGNIIADLKEIGWMVWTGFIWLRIGTNGGHGSEPPYSSTC
jgi:hypothetical protein